MWDGSPPDPQFWDFMPSWQNSPEAIRRAAGDFAGLSARAEGTQAGYCIFEPASGDIAPDRCRQAVQATGDRHLAAAGSTPAQQGGFGQSAINTEAGCESVTAFLEAANIAVTGRQFEMVKKI